MEGQNMQDTVELARELARVARENQLAEIEYRHEDTVLRLTFEPKQKLVKAAIAPLPAIAAEAPPSPVSAPPAPTSPSGQTVNSPLAGVFYRAPRPNAPPFAEAGQSVGSGQTLCIIEAMKLMNEITADGPMKVLKILVENAQVVEAGQPLFEFEPL